MNGVDPQYAPPNGAGVSRAVPDARFDESHKTAIHFYTARTGRDVISELQRGYENAVSDLDRLVFGTMLQQIGGLRLTAAEVADAFTSMTLPTRVVLARQGLFAGFARSATPMTVADAESVNTYYLMEANGEWVIVAAEVLVT